MKMLLFCSYGAKGPNCGRAPSASTLKDGQTHPTASATALADRDWCVSFRDLQYATQSLQIHQKRSCARHQGRSVPWARHLWCRGRSCDWQVASEDRQACRDVEPKGLN